MLPLWSLFAEALILHFVNLSSKNHSFTDRSFKCFLARLQSLPRSIALWPPRPETVLHRFVVTTRDAAASKEVAAKSD